MTHSGQNMKFTWPTIIITEILRGILHTIFNGVCMYKGRLLYPGMPIPCAYKRVIIIIFILQIVKIQFISTGTYMRGNRVRMSATPFR